MFNDAYHPPLPGDLSEQESLHQALRVNQAGEYGAIRIYQGQLAVLKDAPTVALVQNMLQQEQKHLDIFNQLLRQEKVRPTLLHPIWHMAGYGLGVITAAMGVKAAMACTVAVEEVIDRHYQEQLAKLPPNQSSLKAVIAECREDECHHRDTALANKANEAPAYPVLKTAIQALTRTAIWLSKKV